MLLAGEHQTLRPLWGWVSLTPPGLDTGWEHTTSSNTSECQNSAKEKRLPRSPVLFALLCFLFCFPIYHRISIAALTAWFHAEECKNEAQNQLHFCLLFSSCLIFFFFFLQAQDKSLSFQHLTHLSSEPSGWCVIAGPSFSHPFFSLN